MYPSPTTIQTIPITREQYLQAPGETIRQGTYTQTDSPTKSSRRVRWVQLSEWNMQNDFLIFWSSLPNAEKQECITHSVAVQEYRAYINMLPDPTNEDMLSAHLDWRYVQPHNKATLPPLVQTHSRIIRRDGFYATIGNPDYLFVEQPNTFGALYAVMELKTFWKVTPQRIMEVLNGTSRYFLVDIGTAPIKDYHSGRLAMEQIYGYMIHNAKRFGILTTANWWVFLRRENGGQLYMTQPLDCQTSSPPYSFTILQALYYFSALSVQHGHLPETDENGNLVSIALADSAYPTAAPSATGQPDPQSPGDAFVIHPLQPGQFYTLVNQNLGHSILLEPWKPENSCGGKTFRGTLIPNNERIIVKLWDGYKFQPDKRDCEVEIYMKLQKLWGKYTPQLICSTNIDFCYGIIMTEVKVLSIVTMAHT
jgi:hypothetical protein